MTVFVFQGDVWPQGDTVSSPKFRFQWPEEEPGNVAHMNFVMTDSKVRMETHSDKTDRHDPISFGRLMTMTNFFGQSVLDTFGFISGRGITLIMHSVVYENGEESKLRTFDPDLIGLCTSLSLDDFIAVMPFVIENQFLALALSDLHAAITIPAQLFVCCGRAMDCARKIVGGENTKPEKGWEILRERLNISRPYLQFVMNESKDPRHGSRIKGGPNQGEVKIRAWIIINRTIIYLQRERAVLTSPEFHIL